ncbi:MAG TPA: carboxypeptidase-like regulatory domain-containing protein [Pyrinomonadaceae bacterium]|nr:carboxypeptidase-like regulatory domain-containing protein [Pyrinomonadaceae bacterium]
MTNGFFRRARRASLPALVTSLLLLASPLSGLATKKGGQEPSSAKRVGVRLRSFVPNASGSLYFEPTPMGGVVRMTALGLPAPETLMPDAHVFLVWAVAPGERPLRVGELRADASGNGGIEFARPSSFEKYSVVMTVEPDAAAPAPAGVMVFASRAGAVTAFYGEKKEQRLSDSRRRAIDRELNRSAKVRRITNDFYSEVDDALDSAEGGARTLELFGDEIAPNAHGLARLASRNENIYVRTVIKKLPLPSAVGANTFVLWGVVPDGRIAYMGSLPAMDISNSDTYVRVGGFRSSDLDLLVTAEMRRPVMRPSGLRAVSTHNPREESGPAFGAIEGRVVDAAGQPLAGAVVEVRPADQMATSGALPVAYTNEEGRFFLDGVTPGTHMIYASKEDDGYPATFLAFFVTDASAIPKVTVYNKQVTEGTLVRLGPKAARLFGRVVDARTGQPVEEAEIILYREDNPDNYFSFGLNADGGRFQRLIPSIGFRMKVSSPGYEDWYYSGTPAREQAEVIRVEPNTTKELLISLSPLKR